MRSIVFIFLCLSNAVIAKDFSNEVGLADKIVQGRVISNNSQWEKGQIVTHHRVLVRDDISASVYGRVPENEIVIIQLGGAAVHPVLNVIVNQHFTHQITLQKDEEAIFFIEVDDKGQQRLVKGDNAMVKVSGVGTEEVTLPDFEQLALSDGLKKSASSSRINKSLAKENKIVFEKEVLTLSSAKNRIKQLLLNKKSKKGNEND